MSQFPVKRRTHPWETSTPGTPNGAGGASRSMAGTPGAMGGGRVKVEPGTGPRVKAESGVPHTPGLPAAYALGGALQDPRTAMLDLASRLKERNTLSGTDAFYILQESSPGLNHEDVLQMLRKQERIRYNAANDVYTYVPEQVLTTPAQLSAYIRPRATLTAPLALKPLREMVPPPHNAVAMLEELEQQGDVLLMRTLGPFRDSELPKLGRKNGLGHGILDSMHGQATRVKTVFYDEVRAGRKRQGIKLGRLEDELIHQWADVPIAETDDVVKLLMQQDLSAGSNVPEPTKPTAVGPAKKKKRAQRALKITNTHMKQYGYDFSKDYERSS